MAIPLTLLALATLAAAVVAYGTHPGWGGLEHGLQLIEWSRRLQWPLVAMSILCCLGLIAMVILARRRAWWLIGLGPVLALFVHHFAAFAPDRAGALAVLENPTLTDVKDVGDARDVGGVAADDHSARGGAAPAGEDWVVGVEFGDSSYAYPYAVLFRAPVVLQSEHDNRMVLLWSAYANRALAFRVTGPIRGRDLEVVSEPANALLVYDTRHGQFINGIKGLTATGRIPPGFGAPLLTTKGTWKQWRGAHPNGKFLAPGAAPAKAAGGPAFRPPTRPILPAYALPGDRAGAATTGPERRRVAVVGWARPAAADLSLLGPAPVNLWADGTAAMLFRPNPAAAPRAFALPPTKAAATRPAQVVPRFEAVKGDARHPEAAFREIAGDTLWTADGAGVPRTRSAGSRLRPLPVDDDVDRAVMEYWYPGLEVLGGE